MVATIDGHTLSIGDECLSVSFEEDTGYIESTTKCIYRGCWIKDNKPLKDSLPPTCSGGFIPDTSVMHRFECAHDPNEHFDLFEDDVENIVIKDLSATETVTKRRLK